MKNVSELETTRGYSQDIDGLINKHISQEIVDVHEEKMARRALTLLWNSRKIRSPYFYG